MKENLEMTNVGAGYYPSTHEPVIFMRDNWFSHEFKSAEKGAKPTRIVAVLSREPISKGQNLYKTVGAEKLLVHLSVVEDVRVTPFRFSGFPDFKHYCELSVKLPDTLPAI